MKSAFRNLGLRKSQWKYLVMKAESPFDGRTYFFVDKCLPFGAAISCALFQDFSDAIAHIVRVKSGKDNVNYLDDFLFIAILRALCDEQMRIFLRVCKEINFPISAEKTFWSSTQMVFLGFLIDSIRQIVMVPVEKFNKGKSLISTAMAKKKITLKALQKICGFLNFLGRCIVLERAFTRRLYSYTGNPALKPHHHIRLNAEMKADFSMWFTFSAASLIICSGIYRHGWNGKS